MGRKKSKRLKVDDMIKTEYGRTQKEGDRYTGTVYDQLPKAQERSDRVFDTAYNGYTDLLDPSKYSSMFGKSPNPYYEEFAKTGGWNPNDRNPVEGVYSDLMSTGGVSDADRVNIRDRGASSARSLFSGLQSDLDRNNRISGGYSPGYSGQSSALARDSSRGVADAVRDSELAITDRVNAGKLQGASGKIGLMGAINQGRQFGIAGMDDWSRNTQATHLNALGGLRGLRTDTPGETSMLYDNLARSLGMTASQVQDLITQQGNEDTRRWGRYGTVANGLAGAAAAFVPGGQQAMQARSLWNGGKNIANNLSTAVRDPRGWNLNPVRRA